MRDADLLGREEIGTDGAQDQREAVSGKRVVVTGAAGSIGTALCRLLRRLDVASLTMVDHHEHGLYQLARVVPGLHVLASVRDRPKMRETIKGAEIVYHCAALKHVHLCEANAGEAALTNIMGTRMVAEAAREAGARKVLISTDKAVEPINVLGMTKMAAEALWDGPIVRPVNVINSSGSVVPLFEELIATRKPVTIHVDTARLYITAREAARVIVTAMFGVTVPVRIAVAVDTLGLADRIARYYRVPGPKDPDATGFLLLDRPPSEKENETLSWPEEERIGMTPESVILKPCLPVADWHDVKKIMLWTPNDIYCRRELQHWRDTWLKKLRSPSSH